MLKSIELRDFCCYESVRVKIANAGLVLVTGTNFDTEAADSNASGKTTLFKGIGWGLFEQSIDKDVGDGVIREGARKAAAILAFDDGHVFTRSRSKGSPGLVGWKPNGEKFAEEKSALQPTIERLVGMDWATFRNTALFGQRETKRFLSPSTSDRERKELFQNIVGTSIFVNAHGLAKADALVLKHEIDSKQTELDAAKKSLGDLDLDSLKSESKDWEASRKAELKRLLAAARKAADEATAIETEDVEALESDLAAAKDRASKKDGISEELESTRSELAKIETDLAAARSESKFAASSAEEVSTTLETVDEGGRCPLCNSDLASGDAAEHLVHLKSALEKHNEAISRADRRVRKLKASKIGVVNRIDELKLALSAAVANESEAERLKEKIDSAVERARDRAESKRGEARSLLEQARSKRAEANPLAKRLEKARSLSKSLKASAKELGSELRSLNASYNHVSFWVRGFSPAGLPSWALDSVMPYITERTNHWLEMLSDGDMHIEFKTQGRLKSSKELRDKIDIRWEIEGLKQKAPSGGQWKKMEIATDLAFSDLASEYGSRASFLLMDEMLDGLDKVGQQRVVGLLKELRKTRSAVFVISHDRALADSFEHILNFEKRDGISRLA